MKVGSFVSVCKPKVNFTIVYGNNQMWLGIHSKWMSQGIMKYFRYFRRCTYFEIKYFCENFVIFEWWLTDKTADNIGYVQDKFDVDIILRKHHFEAVNYLINNHLSIR